VIATLCSFQVVQAQDQETDDRSPCEIIGDSITTQLIYDFYKGQFESTGKLIDHWEYECGVYDPQIRAKTLFVISINAYEPEQWDSFLYDNLPWFISRLNTRRYTDRTGKKLLKPKELYGSIPIGGLFDSFSREEASYLLSFQDLKPSEKIVLHLLSENDSNYFQLLKSVNRDSSIIAKIYQDEVRRTLNLPEAFFRAGLSIWSPDGNASILGNHPTLTLGGGRWHSKWGWEVDFDLRIFKSKDSFTFVKKKHDFYTDRFTGWAINGFYSRNIATRDDRRLNLKLGGGWDALSVPYEEEVDGETTYLFAFANSFSLVMGLEYGMKIGNGSYLNLAYQRHLMNYTLKKRTTLDGFAHSLRVSMTWMDNGSKYQKLKELRFDPAVDILPEDKIRY